MGTLQSVQALRAVAAILVVIEHSFNSVDHGFGMKLYEKVGIFGSSGVLTFFVISGFIIYYTSNRHFGQRDYIPIFLRKRSVRIYPVYWILGLANIPLLAMMGMFDDRTGADVLAALTLYPSHSSTLIFIGWTLSYEIFFYLVFSLLLPLPRRLVLPTLTAVFVVLMGLRFVVPLDGPAEYLLSLATNSLLLAFLMGAWIAWAFIEGMRLPASAGPLIALLGIAGLGANWMLPPGQFPTVITFGIPGAMVVFGLLQIEQRHDGERLFGWARRLGDASYSIYLCHAVVVPFASYMLMDGVALRLDETIAWTIALVIVSTWISLIFSETVEQPMIRMLNGWFSRRERKAYG